ncbi:diguanylate cyclase [Sulfitobacter sp.]|uniref:diguanylate cyclase n=1 Tax=Sulfitobacter sp. TaxID=1903071 RepID=UPI0030023CDA
MGGSKVQGKILIIDGISTNRIVLKVKLTAAFYDVVQAGTMAEALDMIRAEKPDIVVSALDLPDGSAAQLCATLRSSTHTESLPVLVIACTSDKEERLHILRAGAFDVMNKPVNETLLLGRVRNMIRAQNRLAEWQMRDDTSCALGLAEAPSEFVAPGKLFLVGSDAAPLQGWTRQLLPQLRACYTVTLLRDAMARLHAGTAPDAVIIAQPEATDQIDESFRLISALRASAHTRDIALLIVQHAPDPLRATAALDMGADDVMTKGFEAEELAQRMQFLLNRKRRVAQMLQSVRTGLREVVNDPLTGLYNRRYAMPYLTRLIERSAGNHSPFAVIIGDMDYFKRINDQYGHASGDAVLVEAAKRLRHAVRGSDVVARIGGEEFLIAMPSTCVNAAHDIASRICTTISGTPFAIPGASKPVSVTISLGLALGQDTSLTNAPAPERVDALLDRADKALYGAKLQGRNRVSLSRPESRPAA